jgi:hypothetical protein
LLALVWWVVAVLVIVISGPTNFSRKYQKQEEALPESDPGTVKPIPAEKQEGPGRVESI